MIPVPLGVRVWLAVGRTDEARHEWLGAAGPGRITYRIFRTFRIAGFL